MKCWCKTRIDLYVREQKGGASSPKEEEGPMSSDLKESF